ncbi:MAG TPA: sigma 54-interacting transcriptional regulator [Verrucomicrobiae bacterium]|nr:sigma 54-interacting transcriptional regulator [Verrucomicrobiae bacterium]
MQRAGSYPTMTQDVEVLASKYLALMEVSRVIASYRDLSELFENMAEYLHQLLGFHYLSVAVYEEKSETMRVHVLQSSAAKSLPLTFEIPVESSVGGEAWKSQTVQNFRSSGELQRFPRAYELFREHVVNSFCVLPLTTAHRRVGALGFGRQAEGGYSEEELEFGQLVAAQVAVALDNALHYDEGLSLQKQLARERDRLRLVLEVNNSVVSNLELHDLFHAISTSLRRLVSHDSATLLLPDTSEPKMLRVYALDFPGSRGFVHQDMTIPIEETNPGRAFVSGKPILAGTAPGYTPFTPKRMRIIDGEGLRSSMILPLMPKDSGASVGVLALGSRTESAFTQADLDFVWQVAQQIAIGVKNAVEHLKLSESAARVSEQKSYLEEEIRAEQDFEDIVGSSSALRSVLAQVETVAPTDSTVLIAGETGTGKELIARAIHERSSRRERTFVKINCSAIPMGLLESELFGHEKGAFTGAIARKIGRFELAHLGTLFLDEIGDIPLELQPKLLRVLQEQEFERLGGTATQKVDVRVIAATNRSLGSMVAEGQFRSDLFYRLNVFPLSLPPLRERQEDISLLARYFTSKYSRRMNRNVQSIPAPTLEAMTRYGWPGNVRELQNFIERAVILSVDRELRAPLGELKVEPQAETAPAPTNGHDKTLRDMEREHILEALQKSNWVIGGPAGAAARLGMKRTSLLYRMEKLHITRARGLSF